MFYFETSAAAKLVLSEHGSTALRRWLIPRAESVFSSDLLRTELLRLARRSAPDLLAQARAVLQSIVLVRLSTETCERAVLLEPKDLRSLDALHLAAAMEAGLGLEGIVSYDDRLIEAARALGVPVVSPR
jgi:predicted nucleic acid-binding protein